MLDDDVGGCSRPRPELELDDRDKETNSVDELGCNLPGVPYLTGTGEGEPELEYECSRA